MGIGDHEFVSPDAISKNLRCPICHSVFDDPVSCAGKPCDCVFCRSCLLESLKRLPSCPMDRRIISVENLMPCRVLRAMIGELQVFCCHRSDGCFWSGSLDSRRSHEEVCSTRRVATLEAALRTLESSTLPALQGVLATQSDEIDRLKSTVTGQHDTIQSLELRMEVLQKTCQRRSGKRYTGHRVSYSAHQPREVEGDCEAKVRTGTKAMSASMCQLQVKSFAARHARLSA